MRLRCSVCWVNSLCLLVDVKRRRTAFVRRCKVCRCNCLFSYDMRFFYLGLKARHGSGSPAPVMPCLVSGEDHVRRKQATNCNDEYCATNESCPSQLDIKQSQAVCEPNTTDIAFVLWFVGVTCRMQGGGRCRVCIFGVAPASPQPLWPCMRMASKRPRAPISAEGLAALLRPYISHRKWLAYPERTTAPVNRLSIAAHSRLLRELHSSLAYLSLVPSCTTRAFELLAQELGTKIGLADEHFADWSKTMSQRLRCMLRHFSQALVKKNAWAKAIVDVPVSRASHDVNEECGNGEDKQKDEGGEEEEQDFPETVVEVQDEAKAKDETKAKDEPSRKRVVGKSKPELCGDAWQVQWSYEHNEAYRMKGGRSARSRRRAPRTSSQ